LLIHFSTDYVFDGTKRDPYLEDDLTNPESVYGASKLEGERAALAIGNSALVLRTQWLYGLGSRNFVSAIVERAKRGEPLSVVDDQRGSPTYTLDVAEATAALLQRGCRGLYHVANDGCTTWYGFAREILDLCALTVDLAPCATDRKRYPAPRPSYSVLSCGRLRRDAGYAPRPWQEALAEYLKRCGLA
jgi:dTDP-4-dehydrorhamnose reductase